MSCESMNSNFNARTSNHQTSVQPHKLAFIYCQGQLVVSKVEYTVADTFGKLCCSLVPRL
jgi:hypothetical protein